MTTVNERLKIGLNKLISAHYNAVRTESILPDDPGPQLVAHRDELWAKCDAEHKAFKELLDSCVLPNGGYQG